VWRSPVWKPDSDGEIERLALEAVRERQVQAMNIQDSDQRKKALAFLLQSENGYRLRSMVEIAKSLRPIAKSGLEFDQIDALLVVKNGVIDLTTGDFREGQPNDYLTQCAGTYYDPNAKAERWERFISEIFQNDPDLIAFVQRAIGYTLTAWTKEKVFFFCYGSKGDNGKTTLFETLRALMGDYAKDTSFSTFTIKNTNSGHQESLMVLEGARLVTAMESGEGGTLADDIIKRLTGQDPISGSRKHEHERTYLPKYKLWLAANQLPRVKDVTPAFWRRVVLLPFLEKFDGARADKHLADKLKAELPGILNWALQGCMLYQQDGLNPPQRCIDGAEAWRADNDPLAEFLKTCKIGAAFEVKVSDLFAAYEQFCRLEGVPQAVKSVRHFSILMQNHGFEKQSRMKGKYFVGIGL
jgi:putative DNA primase/helicase